MSEASHRDQLDRAVKFQLRSQQLYLRTDALKSLNTPRFITSFLDNLTLWTKSMSTFRRDRHGLATVPMRRKSDGDTLMKSVRARWPHSPGPPSRDPIAVAAATGTTASALRLSNSFPMRRMFGTKRSRQAIAFDRGRERPRPDEALCPQRMLPSRPCE